MKNISFTEVSKSLLEQLNDGAFLTVKKGDVLNTTTISWGTIGFLWNRNVFVVMVKKPRYTHELLIDNDEFTVSFPLNGQLKEALVYCGIKSGRVHDKFSKLNLTPVYKSLKTPIIGECDLAIECKVMYQQDFDKDLVPDDVYQAYYSKDGPHTVFYGEIVNTYLK